MRNPTTPLLFLLLAASCSAARADCGIEAWIVEPKALHEEIFTRTQHVLTLSRSTAMPQTLQTYLKPDGIAPGPALSASDLTAVSRTPNCDKSRNPLDGLRFPIFSQLQGYAEVVLDARSGKTAWVRLSEAGGALMPVNPVPLGTVVNAAFSKAPEIRVIPFPEGGPVYTVLPGSVFRAQGIEGDYLLMKPRKDNEIELRKETAPTGKIQWRGPDGSLRVWPWSSDGC